MNKEKWLTPLQVIKKHCLECQGYSYKEVKECDNIKCDKWVYRLGHNPKRKGIGGNPNLIKIKKPKIDEVKRTHPETGGYTEGGRENVTTKIKRNLSCKIMDKIKGSVSISESNSEVVIKIEKENHENKKE